LKFISQSDQIPADRIQAGLETLLPPKNAVFWDVTLCESVRTDVSKECLATIFRVERLRDIGKTLALTKGWKKLLNEKLRDLYSSAIIISYHVQGDGRGMQRELERREKRIDY
jgi:hypothetical protein